MAYYPPRSTSQRKYYNNYPLQTTQASGNSPSCLRPPSSNTSSSDPQYNSRRASVPQSQKRIQRSYSPLPRPPIGPIPTARAPSPTPPRPLPRAQTYPSVNPYTHGNSTPRRSEGRRSQGNPEQKNRERPAKKGAHKVDKRSAMDLKNKREKGLEKEKSDYRRRTEQGHNGPVDRREMRPSDAAARSFYRDRDQGNLERRVRWKGQTFRGDPRG
ncbi:hypothetical protein BOTCAL_0176g00020 [Botryotinia calthae]|uniref:Uncharacterized protein n=1 Tax=Botryotinia calthae TaxID=38488 RepID=A0A4Y8D2Y5_9HELO|nr:hypothetical protein BOTCAL_0176g00020 [Botryotinia calthae]